jgi:hypothetical protein
MDLCNRSSFKKEITLLNLDFPFFFLLFFAEDSFFLYAFLLLPIENNI